MKIAILLSGSGSNLQAFIDKQREGNLDVEIVLALSNNPDAYGLKRARNAGIPVWTEDHRSYPGREEFDQAMLAAIKESGAELIVLAGYMRLLSACFIKAFEGRIVNIHPSLLPSFPGTGAAAAAGNYGVKLTGCTVHFVEEQLDSGPVIIQAALPVPASEETEQTLERIHKLEHRIYPQAVQWLAEGRIEVRGRQVVLTESSRPKAFPCPNNDLSSQWLVYPLLEEGF
ncbi:MAG: phosphoribosylglycinamide formyltransferase [Desulfovibrionaceae bacterium]|nr:phosphoribosylglycinamide formyltransferase [Desulfovibrionaceae bacterium]